MYCFIHIVYFKLFDFAMKFNFLIERFWYKHLPMLVVFFSIIKVSVIRLFKEKYIKMLSVVQKLGGLNSVKLHQFRYNSIIIIEMKRVLMFHKSIAFWNKQYAILHHNFVIIII